MTPVLFRKDGEEITAVFPTLPGSPGFMTCYAHIGQHASCGFPWVRTTKRAGLDEYADLYRELVHRGYDDLKVYARIQPWMRDELRKASR